MTGPDVIREVTNEIINQQDLGGAVAHTSKSGGSLRHSGEEEAIAHTNTTIIYAIKLEGYRKVNLRDKGY